jgi:hypothetical protein
MALAGGVILYKGFWPALMADAMMLFISSMVFPLLLIPAAFFGGLAKTFHGVHAIVSNTMTSFSVAWLVSMLALGGAWSFESVGGILTAPSPLGAAARVWAVCGAVAPWALFARLDRENVFFTGLVWMLEIACVCAAFSSADGFGARFWLMAGVMGALSCAQAAYEAWFLKK